MKLVTDFLRKNPLNSLAVLASCTMFYCNVGSLPSALKYNYLIGAGLTISIICSIALTNSKSKYIQEILGISNFCISSNYIASTAIAMMPVSPYKKFVSSIVFYAINMFTLFEGNYLSLIDEQLSTDLYKNILRAFSIGCIGCIIDNTVRYQFNINEHSIGANSISTISCLFYSIVHEVLCELGRS